MVDVRTKIRAILAEQFAILEANVHDDSKLVEDLGADSLDLVEIIMSLEETWGWELPTDKIDELAVWTVADLIRFVDQKLAKTPGVR